MVKQTRSLILVCTCSRACTYNNKQIVLGLNLESIGLGLVYQRRDAVIKSVWCLGLQGEVDE